MLLRALLDGGGPGLCWMSLDATSGQVLQPIVAIGHTYATFSKFFHRQLATKGLELAARPLIAIGV